MRQFNETLFEVRLERGIDRLDTAAMLPRDSTVFCDDVHFAVEGARQLADRLSEFLLGLDPLVSLRTTSTGPVVADRSITNAELEGCSASINRDGTWVLMGLAPIMRRAA